MQTKKTTTQQKEDKLTIEELKDLWTEKNKWRINPLGD